MSRQRTFGGCSCAGGRSGRFACVRDLLFLKYKLPSYRQSTYVVRAFARRLICFFLVTRFIYGGERCSHLLRLVICNQDYASNFLLVEIFQRRCLHRVTCVLRYRNHSGFQVQFKTRKDRRFALVLINRSFVVLPGVVLRVVHTCFLVFLCKFFFREFQTYEHFPYRFQVFRVSGLNFACCVVFEDKECR